MANKRKIPRKRRRFKVTIAGRSAFTIDVSLGGLCVEMMQVPNFGTQVEGTITVEDQSYDFVGEIRWVRTGDPRLGIRSRMGIHFLKVPAGLEAHLKAEEPRPD